MFKVARTWSITFRLRVKQITDSFLHQLKDSILNDHAEEINLGNCAISCDGLQHLCWDKLKYIGFEGANLTGNLLIVSEGNFIKCVSIFRHGVRQETRQSQIHPVDNYHIVITNLNGKRNNPSDQHTHKTCFLRFTQSSSTLLEKLFTL